MVSAPSDTRNPPRAMPHSAPAKALHQREFDALSCLGMFDADGDAVERPDPHARAGPKMLFSEEAALPMKASSMRSLRHMVLIKTSLPMA